jgi:predicted DNA-binding transcriptional regulator YafY
MIAPNRTALVRMHCLAGLLRTGGRFTAAGVAVRFEVSRKTIMRDLEFMRDRMGYAYEWNGKLGRYLLKSAPPAVL